MATDELSNFNFTFVVRSAPRSGPTSSDAWNDSMTELANDLSNLSFEWNNKLIPIVEGLPNGVLDSAVNVFTNGLDGANLWVDQDVVSTDDDLTFYNSTNSRPSTVKEAFQTLYTYVDDQITQVRTDITDEATGLTTDQKNAIGANIFDNTQTSSSSSLDGKSENNRLNVIQLATDLYGSGAVIANSGAGQLTNTVFAMVDALLELHNGNWDDDVALSHVGTVTVTQGDVNTSAPGNDAYAGSPADLEDDLDQLRTQIRNTKGTGSYLTSLSALYGGGADSLEDLLASTSGSGTKAASNPWGYAYSDVDGLSAILDALRDFTGQDSSTDSTPTYTSTNFIADSDSLETSIGALDNSLAMVSGVVAGNSTQLSALEIFVGQDSDTDSTPDYSSTAFVTNGESLESAIGVLDDVAVGLSGLFNTLETTLSGQIHDLTFLDLDDTPTSFTGSGNRLLKVAPGGSAVEFSSVEALDGNLVVPDSITAGEDIQTLSGIVISPSGVQAVVQNGVDEYRIGLDGDGIVQSFSLVDDTINEPPYAEMFVLAGSGLSTALGAQPTLTQLEGNYTADELNLFVHDDGTLHYSGVDTRRFVANLQVSCDVDTTENYHFMLAVNESGVAKTEVQQTLVDSELGSINLTGFLQLGPGDYVDVRATTTSGTANLIATTLNLNLQSL